MSCGHQLIEHCCRLSQGLTNPEVDAGLLTDIMKQLLFSAKMMFVKAGQSQDLALCDSCCCLSPRAISGSDLATSCGNQAQEPALGS